MTKPHIDPEQLAALLDGRLDERRREELLARLADSPEDLATFADAAAVTRDLESEGASAPRARAARWRPLAPWLGVAAAAVVGIGLIAPLLLRPHADTAAAPIRYASLLRESSDGLPRDLLLAPWAQVRGAQPAPAVGARLSQGASARLGARSVDLDVAVSAHESSAATTAQEIAQSLDQTTGGPVAAQYYARIAERAAASPTPLGPLLDSARGAAVRFADRNYYELGAWTEAARVAAKRGDSTFFAAPQSAEVLRRAVSDRTLSADVRAAASRISVGLARSGVLGSDSLLADLTALLTALAR